ERQVVLSAENAPGTSAPFSFTETSPSVPPDAVTVTPLSGRAAPLPSAGKIVTRGEPSSPPFAVLSRPSSPPPQAAASPRTSVNANVLARTVLPHRPAEPARAGRRRGRTERDAISRRDCRSGRPPSTCRSIGPRWFAAGGRFAELRRSDSAARRPPGGLQTVPPPDASPGIPPDRT